MSESDCGLCSQIQERTVPRHPGPCPTYESAMASAKAEIVQLSGETHCCMQCEGYAKERDRLEKQVKTQSETIRLFGEANFRYREALEKIADLKTEYKEIDVIAKEALREGGVK